RRVADPDVVDRLDEAAAEEARPDAVGEVRGEPGVVAGGEPLGQGRAQVFAVGGLRASAAEELRLRRLAAARIGDAAAALIEDDRVAGIIAALAPDLGEERREAVVVVHRPPLEGVVVALRALHADAEEGLRGVL